MFNAEHNVLLENHRSAVADVLQTETSLRLCEKNAEQQRKTIENLEKTREQQRRAAVDTAAKVCIHSISSLLRLREGCQVLCSVV